MKETEAPRRWHHCLIPATKADIKNIMAKLSGLEGRLEAVNTQLTNIGAEIATLKSALDDVDLPADAEASLEKLEALAQTDATAGAPAATTPPAAPPA